MADYEPINWEDFPSLNTPLTAANLRHMDNQIKDNADNIKELSKNNVTYLLGTLAKGQTVANFTSTEFKDNSLVTIYSKPYGYAPKSVDEISGGIRTNWKSYTFDISIVVKIENY